MWITANPYLVPNNQFQMVQPMMDLLSRVDGAVTVATSLNGVNGKKSSIQKITQKAMIAF